MALSEPRFEHVSTLMRESCRVQLILDSSIPFVWHYHPVYELILIRAGAGRRFVAESVAHYGAPDLVLLGPNVPHTWASHGALDDGPHRATIIQFAPDLLGADLLGRREFARVAALLEGSSGGRHFPLRLDDPVLDSIAEVERREALPRLLALLAVLHDLADREGAAISRRGWGQRPSTGGKRLEAVLKVLHERFSDNLPLADAARAASLSPAAFSRFFHAAVGRTFTHYLTDLRIGAAQRLLMSSELPIAVIAARVGFTSLTNFNRRFRERAGCTPREFRNRDRTV